jgi:hypothetical protein
MLKAPGLADRRCRGQRMISPAAASSPSLAPMDHRTSIPKVRARFGTTSTVCLPTVAHCCLAHKGTRVDLTREVEGAEYIERFLHEEESMAILLIGGDRSDRWSEFYVEMIPVADDLYDEHLDELREEGEIP